MPEYTVTSWNDLMYECANDVMHENSLGYFTAQRIHSHILNFG